MFCSQLALPFREVSMQGMRGAGVPHGLFSVLDPEYLNVTPADSGFLMLSPRGWATQVPEISWMIATGLPSRL